MEKAVVSPYSYKTVRTNALFVKKLQDITGILNVSKKGDIKDEYTRIAKCEKNIWGKRKPGQSPAKCKHAGRRRGICCHCRYFRQRQVHTFKFNWRSGQPHAGKNLYKKQGDWFFIQKGTDHFQKKKYWLCVSKLQLDASVECL